jgi:hypothetical protein
MSTFCGGVAITSWDGMKGLCAEARGLHLQFRAMQEKPRPATTRLGRLVSGVRRGLSFDDFAGLDAAGADTHTLASAVDFGLDRLQVHVPAATSGVVGVRDVVAELRAFAAKITFVCHDLLQS